MNLSIHGSAVICSDLKFITLANGTELCSFSIVTNNKYKETDHASYFTAVTWSNTAKFAFKNLKKGARINIDGEISVKSFTNKNGQKVSYPEISIKTLQAFTFGGKNAEQQQQQSTPEQTVQQNFDANNTAVSEPIANYDDFQNPYTENITF